MEERVYTVILEKIGNTLKGKLEIQWSESSDKNLLGYEKFHKNISFNPSNILGDLRNQPKEYEIYYDRTECFSRGLSNFSGYEYEYGFGEEIRIDDDKYSSLIAELNKIVINEGDNKSKKLEMLEDLEKQFNIYMDCSVVPLKRFIKEESEEYKFLSKYQRGDDNDSCKTDYPKYVADGNMPIEYAFFKQISKSLEDVLNKPHRFIYKCSAMTEVICSIIHFFYVHKYELKLCKVCQKIFVGEKDCCGRIKTFFIDELLSKTEKEHSHETEKKRFHETDQLCIDVYDFITDKNKGYCARKNRDIKTEMKKKNLLHTDNEKAYERVYEKYFNEVKKCCCYTNIKSIFLVLSAWNYKYKGNGIGKDEGVRGAVWYNKENRSLDDISEDIEQLKPKAKEAEAILSDLKEKKEKILKELEVLKDSETAISDAADKFEDSAKVLSKEIEKESKLNTGKVNEARKKVNQKSDELDKLQEKINKNSEELRKFKELEELERTLKQSNCKNQLEWRVLQLESEILSMKNKLCISLKKTSY